MANSDSNTPNYDDILDEFDDYYDLIGLRDMIEEAEEEYRGRLLLDPANYKRFMEVYALTIKLCEQIEGAIKQVNAEPAIGNNSITLRVPILYLVDESYALFRAIVARADLISIDPIFIETDDDDEPAAGLEIDICVQDVWKMPEE